MALMFEINSYISFIIITTLVSVVFDLLMGDPHLKYHPVMLIGNTLSKLKTKLHTGNAKKDKIDDSSVLAYVSILEHGF